MHHDTPDSRRLLALLTEHSFRRGSFLLASGKTSDFFIDCKSTVLRADGHALVGRLLFDAIGRLPSCERPLVAVAGVVLGGCPLASGVAMASVSTERPLDAVYVRKEAKGHGTQNWLEGAEHLPEGTSLAVVEDTVTTGGSTLRAVEKLRARGFHIAGVCAVVDRREGAAEAFAAAELPFLSLFDRHDFMGDAEAG